MQLNEERKIILLYLIFGILWIAFSDYILAAIIISQAGINRLQTYKGLIFIIVTSIIFYQIIHQSMVNNRAKHQELENYYCREAKALNNLERLIELMTDVRMDNAENEEDFLAKLFHTVFNILPKADYGSVYFFEGDKVKFIETIGHDKDMLNSLNLSKELFDKTGRKIEIINNIDQHTRIRLETERNKAELFEEASLKIKQSVIFGIYVNDQRIAGISLDIAQNSENEFDQQSIRTLKGFRNLATAFYTIARYSSLQNKFQDEIIYSMLEMLEIHDSYTSGHSKNVAMVSKKIAETMGLSKKQISDIYWTGLLHDIGKTVVPDYVLNKPTRLSAQEFDIIKQHPVWGYQVLKKSDQLKRIAYYVLYHHESWDGKGYPNSLKGEEIPQLSRIITLADAWDAMTSERSYREALTQEEAIEEIKNNRGSQFDPVVVDIFLTIVNECEINVDNSQQ